VNQDVLIPGLSRADFSMTGAKGLWAKTLSVAVLLMSAAVMLFAQSSIVGALSGRLTDLHSKPLQGVALVLRNQATGAEERTTTAKNGAYRFSALAPGEYTLEAENPQLGRGRVDEIVVEAGSEARVQAAMEFAPMAPQSELARAPVFTAPQPKDRPALEPGAEPLSGVAELSGAPLQKLVIDAVRLPQTEQKKTTNAASVSVKVDQSQISEARPRTPALAPLATAPIPVVGAPVNPSGSETKAPIHAQVASSGLPVPAVTLAPPLVTLPTVPQESTTPETTTLSAREVQSLPASGRHWQEFALDASSGSTGGVGGSQGSASAASQPSGMAVDGVGQGLAFGNTSVSRQGSAGQGGGESAGEPQVWVGGHGLGVSEAAIREVQTTAGKVEAESTRASGNRINVETQSGQNHLHGQGFLFDRQNTWGARNPFTQWVKETAPGTETTLPTFTQEAYTPPDHETVWGLGVGGQIRRDKLFWFAALDSYRRNDPGMATARNASVFFGPQKNALLEMLSTRQGESSNNPLAVGVAEYTSALESLAGLLGPAPRTATQWTGFSRLDWPATERHRLTLEAIGAHWNAPGGGLTRVSGTYGSNSFGSSAASEEWLLGRWEAFVTPNLLLVSQGSTGRTIEAARPETPSAFEQKFLAGNVWRQLPQIIVDNSHGFTIGNPSRFGQGSYPDERIDLGQESLDWVRGGLLVKAGFQVSHNTDTTGLLRNQTGTYTYANVINFTSDVWAFEKNVGELNSNDQHNCDAAGTGFGNLPCYSSYSQTIGPTGWHLGTNDWAGFGTAQWEVKKRLVLSAGLRVEREQGPSSIATLDNPALSQTEKTLALGNNWGPRVSLAWEPGTRQKPGWPVVRLGYGMYFGRTENLTLETALTQTGSLKGDLRFFMRPTDNLSAGGAPPFPHVLAGQPASVVKPGAVEFAPVFRNPEIHQGVVALEESLPGGVVVTASAQASLGRRLPTSVDTNIDTPTTKQTITYDVCDETAANAGQTTCGHTGLGPIKATQITVPFYASWPTGEGNCPYYQPASTGLPGRPCPDYQQITNIESRANSTYEAAVLKIDRYGRRGLSLHTRYTYSHAMDWNPNESASMAGNDVLDPANFNMEYGTGNLDVRHSASVIAIYQAPWKLRGGVGKLTNGWMISGVGHYHTGLPYTMRTSGSLAKEFTATTGEAIVGLGPGMNGSGGDNRIYGVGSDGQTYNIGRNTYRYPATWKLDLRLAKRFDLGNMRQLELLAESFNLFNHQNVTELETTGYTISSSSSKGTFPTLNYLTGLKANTTAFGLPLNINATNFYRERQIQLGLRMRF